MLRTTTPIKQTRCRLLSWLYVISVSIVSFLSGRKYGSRWTFSSCAFAFRCTSPSLAAADCKPIFLRIGPNKARESGAEPHLGKTREAGLRVSLIPSPVGTVRKSLAKPRFSANRSNPLRTKHRLCVQLLQQQHLSCLREFFCLQPVEIDAA